MLSKFQQDALCDRLEGWELAEFLQVPIEELLRAALDNDWINPDNVEDLLDFVNLKE